MADILLLCAHPDLAQSRVHRRLRESLDALALPPERLQLRDLYRLYPDYAIDVAAEQQALASAHLVVWMHPVYWYSMPALMKLWLDEVLRFDWAYGPRGQALQGKDLWLLLSTGGSAESYRGEGHNRHAFEDFLLPYAQTARLCGMRMLPPLVLHGAHRCGDEALEAHVRHVEQALLRYPNWCGSEAAPRDDTPADERPLEART